MVIRERLDAARRRAAARRWALMNPRPGSVTLVGWLFLCLGVVTAAAAGLGMLGIVGGGAAGRAPASEMLPMVAVQLAAAVGGWLVLRRSSAGRWLLVGWMSYHVILSGLHAPLELLVHGGMLALLVYVLFRREARDYFRGGAVGIAASPEGAAPRSSSE